MVDNVTSAEVLDSDKVDNDTFSSCERSVIYLKSEM